MKILIICAIIVAAVHAEKYTTKYDNIDLDQILKNDRLLKNYVDCLLDKGTCTPDGAELKKHLPEALANDCANCSDKQKTGSEKMIKYLIDKKPDMWKLLEAKYDQTGSYRKKYQGRL